VAKETTTAEVIELIKAMDESGSRALLNLAETTLPLLKEYVKSLRDVRMNIDSEIRSILQSTRTLQDLHKFNDLVIDFAKNITVLEKTLSPELVATLRKLLE
jgi:GTP1/Obg family GTP-binding protein